MLNTQKNFLKLEIAGIFFVAAAGVFLQNLYELSGGNLVGIIFGSVNDSIWETEKTMLLAYIFWALIEIMCIKIPFKKFAAAKVISLWSFFAAYTSVCLLFSLFKLKNYSMPEFAAAAVCTAFAFFLSFRLVFCSKKLENLFVPSFFMIMLFIALYCSFTAFPPKLYMFMDRSTGIYGIIPEVPDMGAVYLFND